MFIVFYLTVSHNKRIIPWNHFIKQISRKCSFNIFWIDIHNYSIETKTIFVFLNNISVIGMLQTIGTVLQFSSTITNLWNYQGSRSICSFLFVLKKKYWKTILKSDSQQYMHCRYLLFPEHNLQQGRPLERHVQIWLWMYWYWPEPGPLYRYVSIATTYWTLTLTLKTQFRYYVLLPLATNYLIAPLLHSQSKIKADSGHYWT